MIRAIGLTTVRVPNRSTMKGSLRDPYAMPAAPKTPNLNASFDFSTLGGLNAPQRRLTMDPIALVFDLLLCASSR